MAKNKKKSTSSFSRGQGYQFSDLTQNANSIFAVEAPHAFAEKNQFSNSIAGGSSPHKFLIQDDDVVACGSGSESREEDELVYTEPEDGIRSGPCNAHSPTSSPARGINNAGSEGKMDSRTAHNKSCSKQANSASLEPVVGTSVQKDERKAVIAEQHFDPMQTELDVISEEWETVRGRKSRESSGKDLPAEDICREQGAAVSNSLKDNLKTPLGRKNRGIAGTADAVTTRMRPEGTCI
ncbi:hypothetical protein Peur_026113 [Populus x canadensis]